MWTQRDQFSNEQIPLTDEALVEVQLKQRLDNHPFSEKSKAPLAPRRSVPSLEIGDLVYLHSDGNKYRARDRYLVVSVDPPFCNIRKLVGAQFRSASYRVKMSECFRVLPTAPVGRGPVLPRPDADVMDEEDLPHLGVSEEGLPLVPCPPPAPPEIPRVISSPVAQGCPKDVTVCPPRPCGPAFPSPAPVGPAPLMDDGLRRSSRARRAPPYLKDFDVRS